ncbi:SMI1/KNR4 family protein [Streptomyces zaomyceticus]|uniref:SMI1/KNR4 family protein n=1 Tax=Streptomyces zaomyceticus TaxID=68286 RepID=A0ABZ1LLN9_9ACTN|nr:SMI1/KNR4 family protein [Streptomyces zaomyceticus]
MDYYRSVVAVLGEPRNLFADSDSWSHLEGSLGMEFPSEYKRIVDAYAPVQLNNHLYLDHPANPLRPLGAWIARTVESFESTSWGDVESSALGSFELKFGGRSGMIPIASTDRGEYAFLARTENLDIGAIVTWGRDAPEFYVRRMGFGEWLCRYLAGEAMFVPGVTALYPGPLVLESLPTEPGERQVRWYGPERGM